jgi:hypothetical protein
MKTKYDRWKKIKDDEIKKKIYKIFQMKQIVSKYIQTNPKGE